MPLATTIRAALRKPLVPVLFFFSGVTFDSLTLTRIDRLSDNLVLLLYLAVLGALIVLVGRPRPTLSGDIIPAGKVMGLVSRARPYYPNAIQFLLGGLFSAYAIFYSKSASSTSTAAFFALLVVLLVGNEFLHDRATNATLILALYALAACSFFTFFLPVVTGVMTTAMFLFGALLSAALVIGLARLMARGAPESAAPRRWITVPALGAVVVVVLFYFLNWIPPVPLSMTFGGIFHQIAKLGEDYLLSFEKGPWYRVWQRSDNPFRGTEAAYCFTAVFAPVDLHADIYHRWQYRQPPGRRFVTTDRIRLTIIGGREGGYRAYTVKQRVLPGDWRVDVETDDGRTIGLVSFRVEEAPGRTLDLKTISY